MILKSIKISGFRLLRDVQFSLEEDSTVVVGRNNSGKTSLTEFLKILLCEKSHFKLEDFSLGVLEDFEKSYALYCEGKELDIIRTALPKISAELCISYEVDEEYGALGHFIIDLDESCTEASINVEFALKPGNIDALFADLPTEQPIQIDDLMIALRPRVTSLFDIRVEAVDPTNSSNRKEVALSKLTEIIKVDFINAQRTLDSAGSNDKPILGKVLEELFKSASEHKEGSEEKSVADKLVEATSGIQENINKDFGENLNKLAPIFEKFGYPGMIDPHIRTETELDVTKLLSNHTTVYYEGSNGVNLPESFNGLGSRNLLFMLLKLYEFYQNLAVQMPQPCVHLIVIEEPEAHLHPQMQSVFIRQLSEIRSKLQGGTGGCTTQYIVSTHSSHLANEAGFSSIRYFLTEGDSSSPKSRYTDVKNLRTLFDVAADANPIEKKKAEENQDFLHKYLTQTRCDLFFADKAILIEGTTERLMLPEIIRKIDVTQKESAALGSQYLTTIEVGGAYAQRFFPLLNFLELPALVITDIDAVKGPHGTKCKVSEGEKTSNSCIKSWFTKEITPASLISKKDADKIKAFLRVAYQVPETAVDPCGRSFEDAFMLKNPNLFDEIDAGSSAEIRESQAYENAKKVDKSDFAIEFGIDKTEWEIPRYIKEGLLWLAEQCKGKPKVEIHPEQELVAEVAE